MCYGRGHSRISLLLTRERDDRRHRARSADARSRDFPVEGIVAAGEHDIGGGNRELLLGTVGSGGMDVQLVRPNPSKSYDALQLATTSTYVVMLARETNFGGGSAARDVLLFDSDGSLLMSIPKATWEPHRNGHRD